MNTHSPVIAARGLTKRYGDFTAVHGIDLDVEEGECFALLGPNGAGKSTTIRMICCLTEVSDGELVVLGQRTHPGNLDLKRQLGVVSQEDYLDPGLTVLENTEIHGRFYGVGAAEARARALELLRFLQLESRANDMVRQLSGGMRRRLVIARALMGSPRLLILDEPTTGLDPQARLLVWTKLRELRASGVTILITTHYMDEAERLADRLAIVDNGRVLESGTPREVIDRVVGSECVECLDVSDEQADRLRQVAQRLPATRCDRQADSLVVFGPDAQRVLSAWREAGIEPARFIRRPAGLEDVSQPDGEGSARMSASAAPARRSRPQATQGLGWQWPRFDRPALMVARRDFLAWVKYYKSSVLLNFGEPLTNLLALGFGLGTYVAKMNGDPFVDFIGPGLLAVTAMNAVTFDVCFEAYDRLNENGIYQAMIAAPLSASQIVGGELLWEAGRSLLYGLVFFVVLLALGLVHSWWSLLLPLPLIGAGVLFAAPGLLVATWARNHEQLFYYFSLVITPMFLFSGVFFPLAHMPAAVRLLIDLTPLYHVVNIVRALVLGTASPSIWLDALWVVGYGVVLTLLPSRALARRLTT